ncbi:MAG TPA: hypothetical protein DCS93_11795 [Microscillaceae bacterium]|nr:hypothetical protein [Microscillaceae bacterium]
MTHKKNKICLFGRNTGIPPMATKPQKSPKWWFHMFHILVLILLQLQVAFAQPPTAVTSVEIRDRNGYHTYGVLSNTPITDVPLNSLRFIINFDRATDPATGDNFDTGSDADALVNIIEVGGPNTDLLSVAQTSILTASEAGNEQSFRINVVFTQDLKPNTEYTFRINAEGARRKGGNTADDDVVQSEFTFRTTQALVVTPGASSSTICNGEMATLTPIFISETSQYGFIRNVPNNQYIDIVSSDNTFSFDNNNVNKSVTATFLGPTTNTNEPRVISVDANTNRIRITYTTEDATNIISTLRISGVRVTYTGNAATASTNLQLATANNRHHRFNGLTGIALATVNGGTQDVSLNFPNNSVITGPNRLCLNPTPSTGTYSVNTVPGADAYYWTVDEGYYNVDVTPASVTRLANNTFRSTTTQISITPQPTPPNNNYPAIVIRAGNNCRRGTNTLNASITVGNLNDNNLDGADFPNLSVTFCNGEGFQRITRPAVPGATQYQWTIPTNIFTNATNTIITPNNFVELSPNAVGNGVIRVRAFNSCNQGVERDLNVTVTNTRTDNTLNTAFPNNNVAYCVSDGVQRITANPVPGATQYEWVFPNNFTGATSPVLTANNFLDLNPAQAGNNLQVNVQARNGCRRGTQATLNVTINNPTVPTFNMTTPGNFNPASHATNNTALDIANNAGNQTITENGAGNAVFSGPGVAIDNNNYIFYPNLVTLNTPLKIDYTYTENGCSTNGSFYIRVTNASAIITGLNNKYCNNNPVQRFNVKRQIVSFPIAEADVILFKVGAGNVLTQIPRGANTGFNRDNANDTPTDYSFTINPSQLEPSLNLDSVKYRTRVTINVGGSPIAIDQDFDIFPAPNPGISVANNNSSFSVCGSSSHLYRVTTPSVGSTYQWQILSADGVFARTNNQTTTGETVTINWNAFTNQDPTQTKAVTLRITETNANACIRSFDQVITVFPQPPVPTFQVVGNDPSPYNVCTGEQVTYSCDIVGANNYRWIVNNGTITSVNNSANSRQVTIVWGVAGAAANLAVEVTNGTNNCQNISATQNVTINPLPNFTFAQAPNVRACVSAINQTYSINGRTNGSTLLWAIVPAAAGTIIGPNNGNQVTINWGNTSGQSYKIVVTETTPIVNNNGGCSVTKELPVILDPLPNISFAGFNNNDNFCPGAMINLSPSVEGIPLPQNQLVVGNNNNEGYYIVTNPDGSQRNLASNTLNNLLQGRYSVSFTYQNNNGCRSTTPIRNFNVVAPPVVRIQSNTSPIANNNTGSSCANATHTYTINGVINPTSTYEWAVTGGVKTSETIDNNNVSVTVTWGTQGLGTLRLRETNNTGCTGEVTANITITALPTPTFANLVTNACVNAINQVYTLNSVTDDHLLRWVVDGGTIQGGSNVNGKSEITGNGANLESITINWGNGAQGTITVTETDNRGCIGSRSENITLTPLPNVTFTGLVNAYCESDGAITLSPTVEGALPPNPANGKFIIRDASNTNIILDLGANINTFTPAQVVATAGTGDYTLVYQYTNNLNCFNESSPVNFKITPAPKNVRVNIARRFDSRALVFNAQADNSNQNWKWNWTLAGISQTTQSGQLNLNSRPPQNVTYTLEVENDTGCKTSLSKAFNIEFSFQGQCQGAPTQFTDKTNLGINVIGGWSWNFGDGHTSTAQNPMHTYTNPGSYLVTLTVTEGVASYSLTKRIDIFPVITVTPTLVYNESFANGAGGWISHGTVDSAGVALDRSSWQLKTPNGFGNIPGDRGNSWVTDNTGSSVANADAKYNPNEQSYVESPCFDITTMQRPMLAFNYFSDTDRGSDGVVLLYTIDDGATWWRIGAQNQGLEWYNFLPILGKPGDRFTTANTDNQGWSGNAQTNATVKTWKTARFGLDAVLNRMKAANITQKIVRFRVAFGSNTDNSPNVKFDGFAFDDFQINERNRVVLTEFFTNQSADPNGANDLVSHNFSAAKAEAINIHYHTDFPGIDEINKTSEKDVSGRSFHYGIRAVPRIVVDGITRDTMPNLTDNNNWAETTFSTRTLINAPFMINITNSTANGGTLTVNATVNAIGAINNQTVMHVVVIDSTVNLGGVTYYNAVRKMLPDAAGTFRGQPWAIGDNQALNFTWNYGALGLDPSRFRVVVFVADYSSNVIYQAAVSNIQIARTIGNNGGNGFGQVTSITEDLKGNNVKVFPNPGHDHLNVGLQNNGLSAKARWEIVSISGQLMKQGVWHQGYKQIRLNIADLAEGVYLIKVYNEHTTFLRRFTKQ